MIRAISIRQPFASCIIDGPKRVENRTKKMGVRCGQWVAIHASKAFYYLKRDWPEESEYLEELWPELPTEIKDYQCGAIIGLAQVEGDLYYDDNKRHLLGREQQQWASGPVCIVFSKVLKLTEPVPAKGKLGLWLVSEGQAVDIVARIPSQQLGEMPFSDRQILAKSFGIDKL